MMVIGFDPNRPAFNLPEVNSQLDKLKIPNTILFDKASRGEYQEVIAQIEQGKKAMGYRNFYLLGVVFEEAIILALIGFVPSVAIALGLYRLTSIGTALSLVMPVSRAITVLILTIIMCTVSCSIAMRKLQSADPADIF